MDSNETWPRKCVLCGSSVEFDGDDQKFSGFGPCKKRPGKHQLESVIYFHPGARDVQDIRDRKRFAPTIILVPVYDRVIDGKRVQTTGLAVQFHNGKLETSDPEVQYHLEQKPDIAWGDGGLKMWQEIYLTVEHRNAIANAENADLAERNRQLREENALLEQMKREKGVKSAARA